MPMLAKTSMKAPVVPSKRRMTLALVRAAT
jgi:hypothetical protein